MNSLWLVITALAAFAVAYRFYGAFLAARVAVLNDKNATPAHRLRDDIDYQPTRRLVLFGVHFSAIAGPGPLIGPVLAAQWGFLPGFTWIIIGACLAGGVHDFIVLVASVRCNGQSLPKIARNLVGPIAGAATTIATLFIIVATLASVAKVVVNTLEQSAWGMFTIVATIPAALVTGFWMYKIRPGRVGEASIIGMVLVFLAVIFGKLFDDSALRTLLALEGKPLSIILPIYAAVVSILPVWVLLAPRGYLSSYMKVGVIVVLVFGILAAHPSLKMPAWTPYIHGGGPVFSGSVWPFVTIVIMCGALSGFHALIASGTTPKMVDKESDIRVVGYGAMLVEGMVSVTALIAACALEPGDYFKINAPKAKYEALVAEARPEDQGMLRSVQFEKLKLDAGIKEELSGRTAGAVTLALGMAKILGDLPGMRPLMAYLYHFLIMFEVLFILTLLETGTRVARFIVEEAIGQFRPGNAEHKNVLVLEHCDQRGRLFLLGLSSVHGRLQPAVADDGGRQPALGHDRPGRGHDLSLAPRAQAGVCALHGDSFRAGGGKRLHGRCAGHRHVVAGNRFAEGSPVNPGVVGGSGRGDRRAGLLRGADMPDGGRHAGALGGRSRRCPAALVFGAPGAVAAGRGTGRISLDPALLVRVDRIDRT